MQIKSYEQAVRYLESFIGKVRFEITPEFLKHHDPLERMRVLLSLLGNPQDKFKSILVGGTSGKGSTAYLISHILTTSGYKTGLTISPHLQKINERLQINGKSISDGEFTNLLASILDSIEGMKKISIGAPSYFEILIAMAFKYFAQQKVDIAVVEVGMGGEFDATNTLYPLVAVLTNVSLDHTSVLGGTVQKIAKTKAGIIKGFFSCHPEFISGSPARRQVYSQSNEMLKQSMKQVQDMVQHDNRRKPIVVTGVKQPSVIKIVEDKCKEVGAKLYRLGKDFDFKIKKESLEGSVFDLITFDDRQKQLNDLRLSLLGKYQVENASLAVEAVLQLKKFGFKVAEEHIRVALKTAFFPGRFEVVRFKGSPHPLNDSSNLNLKQSANLARANASEHGSQHPLFKSAFRGEARPRNYTLDAKRYTLILDGAHNPTKMKAFLTTLKKLFPKEKKIFIIGFKFDKDIPKMLKQITKVADKIIVTEFDRATDMSVFASAEARSIKYKVLSSKYRGKIIVEKDSKKALDKALTIQQFNHVKRGLGNSEIIVVTGSLYLVGEVRGHLQGETLRS